MKSIPSPRVLSDRQRTRQSINWILKASDKGRGGPIPRDQRITKEILNVLEGESPVFGWLDERHKAAMLAR
jgi:small subunit ribosomal protein S7